MEEDIQKMNRANDFTYPLNVFGPSIRVRNTLRKAIKRINVKDERERLFLVRLLSQREGVSPGNIGFSFGLKNFLYFLLERGSVRRVLFLPPLSPRTEQLFGTLRMVKEFEFEGLEPVLSGLSSFDLVFIEHPHGVRGKIFEEQEFFSFLQDLDAKVAFTVIDDTLREFSESPSYAGRIVNLDRTILVRDLGYIFGLSSVPFISIFSKEGLLKAFEPYLSLTDIPPFIFKTFREAIKQKRYKSRVMRLLREEKEYMREKLKRVDSISVEDRGFDFLILSSEKFDDETLVKLKERGHLVRLYRDDGGRSYIWYPIRKRRENARFAKTLLAVLIDNGTSSSTPKLIF